MNRKTCCRQESSPLNHKRFRPRKKCHNYKYFQQSQIVIVNVLFMLIATIFRFDLANGFVSRATSSIYTYTLMHRCHARSIATSLTGLGPMAPINTGASRVRRRRRRFPFQSLVSLQAISKSTSSFVKKSKDDNFHSISLSVPTMEVMEEVGALLAILSQQTDVLFLDGDLGAGKTTFSRGFIKCKLGIVDDDSEDDKDENDDDDDHDDETSTGAARVEDASLRITSPTYLLSNTYEYREDDNVDGTIGDQTRE